MDGSHLKLSVLLATVLTACSSSAGTEPGNEPSPSSSCRPAPAESGACSGREVCGSMSCGRPESYFDANGCWRPPCQGDFDCAGGERCLHTALSVGYQCTPSVLESCNKAETGECGCSVSSDCGTRTHCVSAVEVPREGDCAFETSSCIELNSALDVLSLASDGLSRNAGPMRQALDACLQSVRNLLAARSCTSNAR